jgi:anti-anti-sigma factor
MMQPADPGSSALHLKLANDLREVPRLWAEADAFAVRAGVPETRRLDLRLALEEAVVNVIRHAWDGGAHQVDVLLTHTNHEVVARVEDDGRPFDPLGHRRFDPDTPLAGRGPGGLGIHLLRQAMDDVAYERRGGRNRLRLTLRWRPAEAPPPHTSEERTARMATLSITTRTVDDAYVCTVDGAIDSFNADQLKGQAQTAFLGGSRRLVFDLTKVAYVASAGLGVFATAMKSFPGKVVFVGLQPYVQQTFRISGFDKLAALCPTVADGLRA